MSLSLFLSLFGGGLSVRKAGGSLPFSFSCFSFSCSLLLSPLQSQTFTFQRHLRSSSQARDIEMEISVQGEDENGLLETLSEQSFPIHSPNLDDILGERKLFPRVSDEYQAEIPQMLSPSEQLKYLASPCDLDFTVDGSLHFLVGLPVQITRAYDQSKGNLDERGKRCGNEAYSDIESKEHFKEFSSDFHKELNDKVYCMDLNSVTTGYGLVPGSSSEPWSDFEIDCFLLGLYICGKNLRQVKRFVESKEVGELLSFYFGRFYGSSKYKRWYDCRKVKGRKGIIGRRLLSRSRQQELVSRLHMSDESRNTLLEESKAFADGRRSLEEYVSIVKSLVRVCALVGAFGIGKGKEDLTTMAMESSKHHALSSRPEMPSGRACSSLTYIEIVKYLTGDFRLSKARSSDLFWEAVWPRLLAKGWHSEETKEKGVYKGSRNWLVFLVPGVKKFKRELLKGADYFDSVSDVLKRVASEPELLMLEAEENYWQSECKTEQKCISCPNSDEDDGQDHLHHHQYLKPRFDTDLANHAKFSIVDTTSVDGDVTSKVRMVKTLPFEMKKTYSLQKNRCREAEVGLAGNKLVNLKDTDNLFDIVPEPFHSNPLEGLSSCCSGANIDSSSHSGNSIKEKHMNCSITSTIASDQADRQPKSNQSHHFGPVVKRRRLSACTKAVTRSVVPNASSRRKKNTSCVLSLRDTPGKDEPASPKDGVLSITRSSVVKVAEVQNGIHGERSIQYGGTSDQSSENEDTIHFLSRSAVDSNQVKPPSEILIPRELKVEMEENGHDLGGNGMGVLLEATYENVESSETAGGSCRRHSSRKRPMSTKALEAMESSFISPKLSRKRGSSPRAMDGKSRVSRRARSKSTAASYGNCVFDAVRVSETIEGTIAIKIDAFKVIFFKWARVL